MKLIRDIRFDKVHAAAYSTREGTIAARNMTDDVPYEEKRARLKALEALQEQIATEINAELLGREMDVLVEGRKRGKWFGRNRNDKLVFLDNADADADMPGKMVRVSINKTSPWSLQGSLRASSNGAGAQPEIAASKTAIL
ncbi:MAG: TRAM domain-containing protein [Chloroflexi bacterium]|nr:TRAM domain-containing protein [Chloroflexota bacterium]